jgi:hypothetical protein
MDRKGVMHALLGLDIGSINTRASYFGIVKGKYKLLASGLASSSLGQGFQLGSGAGAAMQDLQYKSDIHILKPNGELIWPFYEAGLGVDRIAVTISGGPPVRTVLLGLSDAGSLKIAKVLAESMPMLVVGCYSLTALSDEPGIIDTLVSLRPEVLILTGGENGGEERLLERWIEIVRLVCQLMPEDIKPQVIFAGNTLMEPLVKRKIEHLADLIIVPNIRPYQDEMDLVPAGAALDRVIIKQWQNTLPGFKDLIKRTKAFVGTKSFSFGRMLRYLSQANTKSEKGVLALDLGGGSTTIAAGYSGKSAVFSQSTWDGLPEAWDDALVTEVFRWTSEPVTKDEVGQFLCDHALSPSFIPEDVQGLAISQAYGRYRINHATRRLSKNYPWYPYQEKMGLVGNFEPIIASGAILTQAATPGQIMMMVIDGLQPWGVTTIVLDRFHILPMLGLTGAFEPVLPLHVLESGAFDSLGTLITAVSDEPEEAPVLNIRVETGAGKDYDVEILQGTFRRLIIPAETSAELYLDPSDGTDIGFGGRGIGGRLKVPGGTMGVVIDARGRPVRLPDDDEKRVEELKRWLFVLGG